jgi:cytochrome c
LSVSLEKALFLYLYKSIFTIHLFIFMNKVLISLACLLTLTLLQAQTKPKAPTKTQEPKPITVPADINTLLQKYTCLACHKPDQKLVGPAYLEVAKKKYTPEKIVELIYKPEPKNWSGYPPMAPMTNVPKEDAQKIAKWIVSLNK